MEVGDAVSILVGLTARQPSSRSNGHSVYDGKDSSEIHVVPREEGVSLEQKMINGEIRWLITRDCTQLDNGGMRDLLKVLDERTHQIS